MCGTPHVEVKHIDLPAEMQRAMAKQAEAERERRAKVINAEGEFQAAGKLAEAAGKIQDFPYALPHSRIMIHQPMGVTQGQATDIDIQAREIMSLKKAINELFALHTGRDKKRLGMIRKGISS